jgi:lipopolysaccharide export system protein LptA
VNEANHTVVLNGHVVAKQGDVQLQANSVTVHYVPGKKSVDGTSGTIERLEAQGDVIVTRPGEVVKSTAATYKLIEKQILMTGNVTATRAGSVVRGERLVVDLAKETIKLQSEGGAGRVRAVFTPEKTGEKP